VKYPIVIGWSVPKPSDSRNTRSLFNHESMCLSLLRNLIFPRLRSLIIWQPMQTYDDFCHSLRAVDTLKYFLNSVSPCGSELDARMSCLSLLGVRSTKDGSSWSIARNSRVIALIGLNFAVVVGGGKNARIVRSNSRVTKFFVACWAGGSAVEVHACGLARERSAAVVDAMVERGGSVIDPQELT